MNTREIDTNLFALEQNGGERRFAFLSESSFRFFDVNAPASCCVDSFVPFPCVSSDEATFQSKSLTVRLGEDGSLQVSHKDKLVLDLVPLLNHQEDANFELLQKEGHRHASSEGYRGGFEIANDRPVYGLGEKTGPLDKRGYSYINWNTDDPSAHVDTFPSLYQSIPFFLMFDGKYTVGVFLDNTSRTRFDFNKTQSDAIFVAYEEPCLDLYVFVGSLSQVIAEFTRLTGRNPLVPYWALGAQQSRWSYDSAQTVDAVVEGYAKANIPLSVVYLDIDYMDHYKDFSVNASAFPQISRWIEEKHEQGVRIVPIIDAGVKAEGGYDIYDEGINEGHFCTQYGQVYHNEVWPGDSVFPAFLDEATQQWWAKHIGIMLDMGFDGIWNDMNEPASFRGPLPLDVEMGRGVPHRLAHNVYGHHMAKAGALGFELKQKRLFQLTRAGYAGTCRYSGSWAGDNQSIYDHLRLSLPQLMNMSLSGQAYIGVDIGGFGGDATEELLVRWAIAGILSPLYRNHSSLGTKDQEPYHLHDKNLASYRHAVMTRYEILPILYDQLYFAETEGSIPLRPLIYNYPDDPNVINENTEIMLGEDLLLAPALFPGQARRSCYFPDTFVHFETGERYEKGFHLIAVSMDDIPLFYREKGLLVLSKKGNVCADFGDVLRLRCALKEGRCLHFEDAGDGLGYRQGEYNLFEISVSGSKVKVTPLHQGMETHYQFIELERPGQKTIRLPFPKLS